jgi:hypothetical protein
MYLICKRRMQVSGARITNSYIYSLPLTNTSQPIDLQSIYKEGRMTLVLQAYQNGYFTSVRGTADVYDLLESTLRACVHGRPTQYDLQSVNLKLTATEETILVQ